MATEKRAIFAINVFESGEAETHATPGDHAAVTNREVLRASLISLTTQARAWGVPFVELLNDEERAELRRRLEVTR